MSKRFNKKPVVVCVLAAAGGLTAAEQSGLETHLVDLLAGHLISTATAADDSLNKLIRKYDAKRVSLEKDRIVLFDAKGRKKVAPDGSYLFPNGVRASQVKGQLAERRTVGGTKGNVGAVSEWTLITETGWGEEADPGGGWKEINLDTSGDANKLQQANPDVRKSLREAQRPTVQKQQPRQLPGDQFEQRSDKFKFGQ